MPNTDEAFDGLAAAAGVQTAFGTPHALIPGLTTSLALTDGIVLGDAESGDAEAGITIPNIVAISRAVAQVGASFTQSADSFQKADITGFQIAFVLQGNGATALAVSADGEADLATIMPGVEAILEAMGLIGDDVGLAPVEEYTPRHSGSIGGSTIYSTWKIWHGDLEFVFSDCLIDSATFEFTPGGFCVVTCNVLVGTFDHTTGVDGITFPMLDYGVMASLPGPVVEGVAFLWGQTHGFESLVVTIANAIEKFGDSNVATTGERQSQTNRVISVTGTLYVETTDSALHFTTLKETDASLLVDLSFQVGTPAVNPNVFNAFKVEVLNLQAKDIKYNRVGSALVVELNDAKATGLTAGSEFKLTMN